MTDITDTSAEAVERQAERLLDNQFLSREAAAEALLKEAGHD
jgi:hypothetical protein